MSRSTPSLEEVDVGLPSWSPSSSGSGGEYHPFVEGTGDSPPSAPRAPALVSVAARDAILRRLYDRRGDLLSLESAGQLNPPDEVELSEISRTIDRLETDEFEEHVTPAVSVLDALTAKVMGVRAAIERHRR